VNEVGDLFDEYAEAYEQALSNAIAVSAKTASTSQGPCCMAFPLPAGS